ARKRPAHSSSRACGPLPSSLVSRRDDVVPLDAGSGSSPLACLDARLVPAERGLALEFLRNDRYELVISLLDLEAKTHWLHTREIDACRETPQNDPHMLTGLA